MIFLEGTDRLMVQCNKEGGNPFNFTQIELVPDPMAVQSVSAQTEKGEEAIYTLSGVKVKEAKQKGIYIINGKVVSVK